MIWKGSTSNATTHDTSSLPWPFLFKIVSTHYRRRFLNSYNSFQSHHHNVQPINLQHHLPPQQRHHRLHLRRRTQPSHSTPPPRLPLILKPIPQPNSPLITQIPHHRPRSPWLRSHNRPLLLCLHIRESRQHRWPISRRIEHCILCRIHIRLWRPHRASSRAVGPSTYQSDDLSKRQRLYRRPRTSILGPNRGVMGVQELASKPRDHPPEYPHACNYEISIHSRRPLHRPPSNQPSSIHIRLSPKPPKS